MRYPQAAIILPRSSIRTRRVAYVAALLLGMGGYPLPAGAARHAIRKDAKRQIVDMEAQWRDAQLTGNVSEMEKLLSDDYFGISMTGQVNTKVQQLDRIRNRTLTLSRIDLSDLKVKLLGMTAIVTSRAEIEGVNDGAPIRGSFRYTRVYQRMAGGPWRITNFEATRIARAGDAGGQRAAAEDRP